MGRSRVFDKKYTVGLKGLMDKRSRQVMEYTKRAKNVTQTCNLSENILLKHTLTHKLICSLMHALLNKKMHMGSIFYLDH